MSQGGSRDEEDPDEAARRARDDARNTQLFNEWSRLPREERAPFWDWSHGRRKTA